MSDATPTDTRECNPKDQHNVFLAAALDYASRQIPIFPCNPASKAPLTPNGHRNATTDCDQIRSWWQQNPDAMIGMPTGAVSNRVVVDLDLKGDKNGIARWREMLQTHDASPVTFVIRTASGGEHWHYLWPGVKTKSTVNKIAAGIDTRGDGGYVIMAPSVASCGAYTVLTDVPVAPLPPWLVVLFQQARIIGDCDNTDTSTHANAKRQLTQSVSADEQRIVHCLRSLDPDSSYADWLAVGMALHDWDERRGLPVWLEWSRKGSKYLEGELEMKWKTFHKQVGGVTIGTLFRMAGDEEIRSMPVPTPLPDISAVEPFQYEMLPDSIAPWIRDICDRMQCRPDIPAVTAVVAMSTLIGRKVGIRPKRYDDWVVTCNLWGAGVTPPGYLKTPSINAALTPLKRIEHEETERYQRGMDNYVKTLSTWTTQTDAAMGEIKAAIKAGDAQKAEVLKQQLPQEPKEPARRRLIVNDSTIEALGEILRANPNGVMVHRDELVGFLKSLEKDNQKDARSFYLECWNGDGRFTTDRVGRGTIEIECAIVSIMGGIQPGPLQQYVSDLEGSGDDGLLQRFQLLVWPDPPPRWHNVDRFPDHIARDTAFAVYQRLHDLSALTVMATSGDGSMPYLRFCDEAQKLFDQWRESVERRLAEGSMSDAMQSHISKYRKLIPALALIFCLADGGKAIVDAGSLKRALEWARYLESHARRLYGSRRNTPVVLAARLLDKIRIRALADGFTIRDIYRHQWSSLGDPQDVLKAVHVLVEYGYLLEQSRKDKGRPCSVYRINPHTYDSEESGLTELPIETDANVATSANGGYVSSGSEVQPVATNPPVLVSPPQAPTQLLEMDHAAPAIEQIPPPSVSTIGDSVRQSDGHSSEKPFEAIPPDAS